MSYLINPLKRLFDFQGRATRKEFWLFMLWLLVLTGPAWIAIMFICLFIGGAMFSDMGSQQSMGWIGVFICFISSYLAALLLPLSLRTRRLHDIGLSGWWQLILLVPSLGRLVMLIFMLIPSEKQDNRFGHVPAGILKQTPEAPACQGAPADTTGRPC